MNGETDTVCVKEFIDGFLYIFGLFVLLLLLLFSLSLSLSLVKKGVSRNER